MWTASPASAQAQVFVANYNADTVTVYPRNANGDVPPTATILGVRGPHQMAVHRGANELFVASNLTDEVTVHDLTTGALKRSIAGPSTGIVRPTGMAVDEVNGELYVINDFANSVTVFDVLASGDATPKRAVLSSALSHPVGIAIDLVHDEIVVASYGNDAVSTFPRTAAGTVAATRMISGGLTGLAAPQGVVLDPVRDEIVVANSAFFSAGDGSVLVFPRLATGDVAPTRRLAGTATKLCHPYGVAIDRITDELVVANFAGADASCASSVTTYTRTAAGEVAPLRAIEGALTGLTNPASAAITSASTLTLKKTAVTPSVRAGSPVAYEIKAVANGGPVLNVVLRDMLPPGLTWSLGGANADDCVLDGNELTCAFGDLAKGASREIQVSALSSASNCPGVTNQALAIFSNGIADVTSLSPLKTITIRCK